MILRKIDKFWFNCGQNAFEIAIGFLLIGVALTLASYAIGTADVTWTGYVDGVPIKDLDPDLSKQVGFFWAPNWSFTAIILMPCALLCLCLARATIEPTLLALVEAGMLRRTDGNPVETESLLELWAARSAWWMLVPIAIVVIVVIAVIPLDFVPVVGRWLLEDGYAAGKVPDVTIMDPNYEFDWSISALFTANDHPTNMQNFVFSLLAYIHVAVFGTGFILAAIMWFLAFPSFIRTNNLAKHGLELIPDITSADRRCGFELFEPLYKYILIGAVLTAILALMMHLQNVYLRAPEFGNFFAMVFGSAIESVEENFSEGNIRRIFGDLITVRDALRVSDGGLNLQFAVTALGLFILIVLVSGTLILWLSVAAQRGVRTLRKRGALTGAHKRALHNIRPWPVPSIPIWFLVALVFLIILSMIFVNFLTVVLVILFVRVTSFALYASIAHYRHPQEDFDDDPDV